VKLFSLNRPESLAARGHWISNLVGYLIFIVVAIRKLAHLSGIESFSAAAALLAVSLFLFATLPPFSRRFRWYRHLYFITQVILIQSLGLLQPYEDTWSVLYIPLSLQAWREYPRRGALFWSVTISAFLFVTMVVLFGWFSGLGLSLTILAAALFLVSYNHLYVQAESSQAESQALLAELQQAHGRLKEYASQVDDLAAAQERERLMRALHDSVSQIIFSITLTAEATRLLLEKDPPRAPEQLDRLQELTGSALSQMRALISQWRPV
jgi:signal transduction histidine kinase